jgi:hypothetical protein
MVNGESSNHTSKKQVMENDKFNLIGAGTKYPFGSYVSSRDRTTLSRRFLTKGSKNVYLKRTGTIANRPGLLRRGTADATNAGVLASFEWYTSLGTTRPLRVANGKLEVESDLVTSGTYVWYTLLDSLTNTRLIFDTWWNNTLKKDVLLFCDGTDDLKEWSGAIGVLDSATTTATVIGLTSAASGLGFKSAGGTVLINGTEYTYGGISGSTLTGAQDATSEADDSAVLEKPTTDSNAVEADFTIDFIRVVGNQLYAGSETSRLVYVSKNTDYSDFTSSNPRAAGEGDTLTLDEIPTGIGERDGKAHISTKKGWYVVSFNQITIGSNLSEQTKVDKIPMAGKKGALRHEFITNVGNDLIYLTEDQQLHIFGNFPNFNQPQFPSISKDIKDEIALEDFAGGHIRSIGDFIYLTAPNNGRVWLHETRTDIDDGGNPTMEKFWHPPFIWNLARILEINGTEYGHSNAHPQIYQLWETLQWHDDSPSDDPIPYDSLAVFPYWGAHGYDLVTFDHLYVEGYMTQGSLVDGAVAYEYQGQQSTQAFIVNDADTNQPEFYVGDIGIALGDSSLGDNPLGDQTDERELDQELVPKFRIMAGVSLQNVHEFQPRVYSTELDSRWEILRIGANEQISEELPTNLRR